MAAAIVIDTDVCIDYLRGRAEAVEWLEQVDGALFLSTVTVAELYAGVREGAERDRLGTFLRAFEVLPVDERVAELGGLFRRDYRKSHGAALPDALIAATAKVAGAALATLNESHFPMVDRLLVPYRKS